MNPLKSEMKIGMLNTLGADIEDIAEKLEQQEQQLQGGVAAARQASFAIGVLFAHLDRDAQEGKFADITTPEAAVELARTWLNKAVEAVNGVRSNMEASRLVTTGKAQAMRETVGRLKKDRDDEEAKLKEAAAKGNGDGRAHLDGDNVADLAARKKPAKKTRKRATRAANTRS